VQIAALHSSLTVPCRTPGGTEAADPPQILQQFALDAEALLAVLVDESAAGVRGTAVPMYSSDNENGSRNDHRD